MNNDPLDVLLTRRSVKAMDLQEPGPDDTTLQRILSAGLRVPDHGKLGPWRLIVFQGTARSRFGEVLKTRYRQLYADASDEQLEQQRARFERAPVVIAVVSVVRSGIKIPEWEQQLSAGAVCQNLLVAATLAGFRAQWLTEWYAFDAAIDEALELEAPHERIAGFIYVGSSASVPAERSRPTADTVVRYWS